MYQVEDPSRINNCLKIGIGQTNSWIIGTILGDAYIDKSGRLCLEHSIQQEEYLIWKFKKLQAIGVLPNKALVKRRVQNHKKSGKCYETVFIRSKNGIFLPERQYFYSSGKKEIPADLALYLTAEALAVWFMDDGGRNSAYGSGLVIDISGYSPKSQEILSSTLYSQFKLETTFHRRSEKNTKLYIRVSSVPRFYELVEPWMFAGMKYKLSSPGSVVSKKVFDTKK
jgi:hypothetical protein